jgi:hypothetical protein
MRRLDIGAALSGAMDLYAKHWQLLLTLSLTIYGAIGVAMAIILGLLLTGAGAFALFAAGMVLIAVGIIANYLVQGMMILAVNDLMTGVQNISVGKLFERATPRMGALFVTSLLAGLGVLVGLIFLVVPGIYLAVMWAFAAPVVMLERRSAGDALGRSKSIVEGNGWAMLGLIVIVGIITSLANKILGGILAGVSPNDVLDQFLRFVVPGAIVGPFSALVSLNAYHQLADGDSGDRGNAVATAPTSIPAAPAQPIAHMPAEPTGPIEPELPPSPLS